MKENPDDLTWSRRQLLKKVLQVSKDAILLDLALGHTIASAHQPATPPEVTHEFDQQQEELLVLSETAKFYQSLGFRGKPWELRDENLNREISWNTPALEFTNDLPESQKSYGMRNLEVIQLTAGPNATRLEGAIQSGSGSSFFPIERVCNLESNIRNNLPNALYVTGILGHEFGHGIDPGLAGILYPREMLVRIAHGKWQILAEIPNLNQEEQKLFINADYLRFTKAKRALGEEFGHLVVNQKSDLPGLIGKGENILGSTLAQIAKQQEDGTTENRQPLNVIFTKKVCLQIGDVILQAFRDDKIDLTDELFQTFQNEMLHQEYTEAFAEIVRLSLTEPEKLGRHPKILGGVTEILSALQGKPVNIFKLSEELKHTSKEVMDRYYEEEAALNPVPESQPVTEQEIVIQTEVQIQEVKRSNWENFTQFETIPNYLTLNPEQFEVVQEYSQYVTALLTKRADLQDGVGEWFIGTFDPIDKHIWETRAIEDSVNTKFIKKILDNPEQIADYMSEIERRMAILKAFVDSESFEKLAEM